MEHDQYAIYEQLGRPYLPICLALNMSECHQIKSKNKEMHEVIIAKSHISKTSLNHITNGTEYSPLIQ